MIKHIVQMPNMPHGEYVKDWQYSQGYFDFCGTNDMLMAKDFSGNLNSYLCFFKNKGGRLIEVTVHTSTKDVSENVIAISQFEAKFKE